MVARRRLTGWRRPSAWLTTMMRYGFVFKPSLARAAHAQWIPVICVRWGQTLQGHPELASHRSR